MTTIQICLSSPLEIINCDYCGKQVKYIDKFVIMANPLEHSCSIVHTECFVVEANKKIQLDLMKRP